MSRWSLWIGWNRRNWNIECKQEKSSGIKRSHFISICTYLFIIVEEHLRSVLDERKFGDVPDFGWTLKICVLRGLAAPNGSFSWIQDLSTTPHQLSQKCSLACVKIKQISTWNAIEDCSKESTIARQPNILSRIRFVQKMWKDLLPQSLCSDVINSF